MIPVSKLPLDAFAPSDGQHSQPRKRTATTADKILTAFHAACDKRDTEIASSLLKIFESAIFGVEKNCVASRQCLDSLVAAHERLWYLKQTS